MKIVFENKIYFFYLKINTFDEFDCVLSSKYFLSFVLDFGSEFDCFDLFLPAHPPIKKKKEE